MMETQNLPSSGRVFISYRRQDSAAYAGRLYDRMADRFGDRHVFMDVDSIEPGVDFEAAIEEAVGSCQVVLALIGREWLTATNDEGRRRLDDPGDIVRLEIEAALSRDIRIIPILLDGTRMPQRGELPRTLEALSRRNAFRLEHESFRPEVNRLLELVEHSMSSSSRASVPVDAAEPITANAAASPSAAQEKAGSLPPVFWGTWAGTATELVMGKYPITLSLYDAKPGAIAGQSIYPTLGCEGVLELREAQNERAVVKEHIVKTKGIFGRLRCTSGLIIELQLIENNEIYAVWAKGACTANLGRSG